MTGDQRSERTVIILRSKKSRAPLLIVITEQIMISKIFNQGCLRKFKGFFKTYSAKKYFSRQLLSKEIWA